MLLILLTNTFKTITIINYFKTIKTNEYIKNKVSVITQLYDYINAIMKL